MKKNLLLISFFFTIAFSALAQTNAERKGTSDIVLSVFPNPAVDFISVSNDDNLHFIAIFNLLGRKVKHFDVDHTGAQYDISDLPNGMYSVQLVGKNNKVVTTQRLTVR